MRVTRVLYERSDAVPPPPPVAAVGTDPAVGADNMLLTRAPEKLAALTAIRAADEC